MDKNEETPKEDVEFAKHELRDAVKALKKAAKEIMHSVDALVSSIRKMFK